MDIGKVIHYYDKISVAVVELMRPLSLQDRVVFRGKSTEFEQVIDSMQIQHRSIERADVGQEVAVKVHERVRCGDRICLPDEES
jgi:U32 family peptidase